MSKGQVDGTRLRREPHCRPTQPVNLSGFRSDAARLLGASHPAVIMLRPFGDEISREDLRVLLPSLIAVLEVE
jgi:hypothetical protein